MDEILLLAGSSAGEHDVWQDLELLSTGAE